MEEFTARAKRSNEDFNITSNCEYTTPVLRQLHWLSIEERIVFKILLLTFKCLCDHVTKYVPTAGTI